MFILEGFYPSNVVVRLYPNSYAVKLNSGLLALRSGPMQQ